MFSMATVSIGVFCHCLNRATNKFDAKLAGMSDYANNPLIVASLPQPILDWNNTSLLIGFFRR